VLLPGLACLAMIEATVTRDGKTTTRRHYHLSSRALDAAAYLAAARARRGPSRTACIGSSTSPSTKTAPASRKDHAPENLATVPTHSPAPSDA